MKCDLVFSVPCLWWRTRAAAGSSVHVSVLHLKQQNISVVENISFYMWNWVELFCCRFLLRTKKTFRKVFMTGIILLFLCETERAAFWFFSWVKKEFNLLFFFPGEVLIREISLSWNQVHFFIQNFIYVTNNYFV